jgi:hypothetical protein
MVINIFIKNYDTFLFSKPLLIFSLLGPQKVFFCYFHSNLIFFILFQDLSSVTELLYSDKVF